MGRYYADMVKLVGGDEKKDEKEKMEEKQQLNVAQIIKRAGLLHKTLKAYSMEERGAVNEEEDARLLNRCEAKRKALAKHWQCDGGGAERGGKALGE